MSWILLKPLIGDLYLCGSHRVTIYGIIEILIDSSLYDTYIKYLISPFTVLKCLP